MVSSAIIDPMFERLSIFLIVATLALGQTAFADWERGGQVGFHFSQYSLTDNEGLSNRSLNFHAQWKSNWKPASSWSWRSDLALQTFALSREVQRLVDWNAKSFFLQKRSTEFDLKFGYQTLKLDGPDFFNPADVVNPKSWIDPTEPQSLGSPALSISHEGELLSASLFFFPLQTEPQYPGELSLWWPRENRIPIERSDVELRIRPSVMYQFQGPVEVDRALSNNIALQIQHKSEAFEFQMIGFEGLANSPFLLVEAQGTAVSLGPPLVLNVDSQVQLRALYYRQQALAATWVLPLTESLLFKGGVQSLKPLGRDARVPGSSSSRVLGLEKNFELLGGPLSLILEWINETRSQQAQIGLLRSVFENTLGLAVRKSFSENTQLLVGILFDQTNRSSVVRTDVQRRVSDKISFGLKTQFLSAPSGSLLELYDRHDRGTIEIIYYF